MKSLINWLVVMFMGMFWILRIVVAYMDATGKDFMVKPINSTTEIVLLFVTFVCILLVIKRKWIGTIIYSVTYLLYFGADLVNILKPVIFDFQPFNSNNTMQVASSFFAIIIVIMLIMDTIVSVSKAPTTKKVDWFYENKNLDRKMDDRSDKNNYRMY